MVKSRRQLIASQGNMLQSFSPIATCAVSTAWFMVRAQMWRLWTAVTPFTASRPSRTSLYLTPAGVPESWMECKCQTSRKICKCYVQTQHVVSF